jgi:hypothetical protein
MGPADGTAKVASCKVIEIPIEPMASPGNVLFRAGGVWPGFLVVMGLLVPNVLHAGAGHTPQILLHVQSVTVNNQCSRVQLECCTHAVSTGQINTLYHLYVLAAPSDSMWLAGSGLGGIQFGIHYPGVYDPAGTGSGLCVFSWTLCATLEFPTPQPVWPSSGGGTIITWDVVNNCQQTQAAVAGYFYMCAYQPGAFAIRRRPVDDLAKVVSCDTREFIVLNNIIHTYDNLAWAYFGRPSSGNPCNTICPPTAVQPATWSRIKAQIGQ